MTHLDTTSFDSAASCIYLFCIAPHPKTERRPTANQSPVHTAPDPHHLLVRSPLDSRAGGFLVAGRSQAEAGLFRHLFFDGLRLTSPSLHKLSPRSPACDHTSTRACSVSLGNPPPPPSPPLPCSAPHTHSHSLLFSSHSSCRDRSHLRAPFAIRVRQGPLCDDKTDTTSTRAWSPLSRDRIVSRDRLLHRKSTTSPVSNRIP